MSECCRCCEAAAERGDLDHRLGAVCPYPVCDWCSQRRVVDETRDLDRLALERYPWAASQGQSSPGW